MIWSSLTLVLAPGLFVSHFPLWDPMRCLPRPATCSFVMPQDQHWPQESLSKLKCLLSTHKHALIHITYLWPSILARYPWLASNFKLVTRCFSWLCNYSMQVLQLYSLLSVSASKKLSLMHDVVTYSILASCPLGPVTANGVDWLTEIYVLYMEHTKIQVHRPIGCCRRGADLRKEGRKARKYMRMSHLVVYMYNLNPLSSWVCSASGQWAFLIVSIDP